MRDLLSRYAEAAFWMARYIERAENLARVLDVNETFSRDSAGGQNWMSVLELYDDGERFFEHHDAATAEAVIRFYVLELSNPGSILSTVRMARENARTLRPLISTEMWTQLNIFHNKLRELTPEDARKSRLARLCGFIKEACQAHTGITEGTFYRDAGWYFYQMGRNLERADQTTRLLDAKYHLLLPEAAAVGSPVDASQWNAVLRSASGYHAFRRIYPSGMEPVAVAGFLMFHESFPRSVAACIDGFHRNLSELRRRYVPAVGEATAAEVEALRVSLENSEIEQVISQGLHEYIDSVQLKLISLSNKLGQDFFGAEVPDGPEIHGAAQA
ncbi:MAG: alpha-E domain-containing protein [Rhodospirillales bacterium]|nr:alpha-E domain-containing protein [Rhodospirillales bacterium]